MRRYPLDEHKHNGQSCHTVEVKETYKKPKLDTSKNPCNVKAVKDGVITRIQAYNGRPVVTKGSGVVNGQILVSGLDETKQGDMRYLRANAKVYADITEQQTLSIPKKSNLQLR